VLEILEGQDVFDPVFRSGEREAEQASTQNSFCAVSHCCGRREMNIRVLTPRRRRRNSRNRHPGTGNLTAFTMKV